MTTMVAIENQELNMSTGTNNCEQANLESNDDEGFLELPRKEAAKTKYPPGCPVQMCIYHDENTQENPHGKGGLRVSKVVVGHVEKVGIAWYAGRGNRETLYKVILSDSTPLTSQGKKPLLVKEDRLQFATGTHVWFWNVTSQENAIVVAANHLPQLDQCACIYSVQCNAGDLRVYHGVTTSNLAFRLSETPPQARPQSVVKLEDDPSFETRTTHPEDHPAVEESSSAETDSNSKPYLLPSSSAVSFEPLVPDSATSATRLSGNAVDQVRNATETNYEVSGNGSGTKGSRHATVSEMSNSTMHVVLSGKIRCPTRTVTEVARDKAKSPTTGQVESLPAQDNPTAQTSPRHEHSTPKQVPDSKKRVRLEPQPTPTTMAKIVRNTDPSRLQWIAFGARHDFKLAIAQSFKDGDNPWRRFLYVRCLSWHLRGECSSDCWRKNDHTPLSDAMVDQLEEGLRSVMSSAGPIFCKPSDRSKRQRLFY